MSLDFMSNDYFQNTLAGPFNDDNEFLVSATIDAAAHESCTLWLASVKETGLVDDEIQVSLILPVVIAMILTTAAAIWIRQLTMGDQGLGSYLSDGRGYGKSGFRTVQTDDDRAVSSDPMPWLRLPQLDFVEVAGQKQQQQQKDQEPKTEQALLNFQKLSSSSSSSDGDHNSNHDAILRQLDSIRERMNVSLAKGDLDQAIRLRKELEALMKESGITFELD